MTKKQFGSLLEMSPQKRMKALLWIFFRPSAIVVAIAALLYAARFMFDLS